jgi:hypothetical protein
MNTYAKSTLIGATVKKIQLPKDFTFKTENHKLHLFYYIKAYIRYFIDNINQIKSSLDSIYKTKVKSIILFL